MIPTSVTNAFTHMCTCYLQIFTTRAGKDVLEAQGVHKCKPLLISIMIILLFISRAVYNLVALWASALEPYLATDMVCLTSPLLRKSLKKGNKRYHAGCSG